MYIHNPISAIIFRIVYLILSIVGIMINLAPFTKSQLTHMLSYFTILTNILCIFVFIHCIFISIYSLKHNSLVYYGRFTVFMKGLATTSIILASVAYHYMLQAEGVEYTEGGFLIVSKEDLFVHYLVPFLTVADWFLFQPKGLFKKQYPVIFMIYPFTYFYIVMLRTPYYKSYPYFFMDIAENGINTFFKYLIYVSVLSFVIGYLLYLCDYIICRLFPTSINKRNKFT